ncbi:hypothetical protein CVT25_005098 [Psilocybe cyanescens]|uniref:Uncharacterized protein n=1 Tax=Psilocybe cyanescens TaxID=93625 RepID=A0A409XDY3_PSICY|nr:hypothetical protein CVT25_005098 [Psilocybe cyanescens]
MDVMPGESTIFNSSVLPSTASARAVTEKNRNFRKGRELVSNSALRNQKQVGHHPSTSANVYTKPVMKPIIPSALVLVFFMLASVYALPQISATCTNLFCRPDKPVCPVGQAATGSDGCWGCCAPVLAPECEELCLEEKPICPAGQMSLGTVGCWGCLTVQAEPQANWRPCPKICHQTKPMCHPGEAATGGPGCWGCCQPKPLICTLACFPFKPQCGSGQIAVQSGECWTVSTILFLASFAASVQAIPQGTVRPCPAICHLTEPRCPPGEAATGGRGCWGCCQPVRPQICTLECSPVRHDCAPGWTAQKHGSCWSCCRDN